MNCPECGAPGSDTVCARCGAPRSRATAPWGTAVPAADWAREVRFHLLTAHPEVRALLARAGRINAPTAATATGLELHDAFAARAAGAAAPRELASVVGPILTRMGVRADQRRVEAIHAPAGRTIVAVLGSFAARGNTLKDVHQARDGCAFEAALPSDVWAWEGTLLASITAEADRSRLELATTAAGPMDDRGKTARRLQRLLDDVRAFGTRTSAA
jgi:hypothetical protein